MSWEAITALTAIVLPIAGVLGWVAYKHPKGYEFLYAVLMTLCVMLTALGVLAFLMDVHSGLYGVSLYAGRDSPIPASEVLKAAAEAQHALNWAGITFLIGIAITAYLSFLRGLHWILAGAPMTMKVTIVNPPPRD